VKKWNCMGRNEIEWSKGKTKLLISRHVKK